MPSLSEIVTLSIIVRDRTPSQTGFGTPLIAAYHTAWPDRVRAYTDPDDLLDDGFVETSPAYVAASMMWAQEAHPPTFKVGRRATAFQHAFDLTPVNTTEDFVYAFSVHETEIEIENGAGQTVGLLCDAFTLALHGVAASEAGSAGPFNLTNNWTLTYTDSAGTLTATFNTGDFVDIAAATAAEVRAVITADWGVARATVASDPIVVTSVAKGSTASFVLGGTARAALGFDAATHTGTGISGVECVDNTTHVEVSAASAGVILTLDFSALNLIDDLLFEDQTDDTGLATDLAAINSADVDWYGLVLDTAGDAGITAAAAWAETNRKMLMVNASNSAMISGATDDLASTLKASAYAHMVGIFAKSKPYEYGAAGALSRDLTRTPGSSTLAHKTIITATPDQLTASQDIAIRGKNWSTYTTVGGVPIIFEGKTPSGRFSDVTRFIDFLYARMQESVYAAFLANEAIPYTPQGQELLNQAINAPLLANVSTSSTKLGLAATPAPQVIFPALSSITDAEKAARRWPRIRFKAKLSGAVHSIDLDGELVL